MCNRKGCDYASGVYVGSREDARGLGRSRMMTLFVARTFRNFDCSVCNVALIVRLSRLSRLFKESIIGVSTRRKYLRDCSHEILAFTAELSLINNIFLLNESVIYCRASMSNIRSSAIKW